MVAVTPLLLDEVSTRLSHQSYGILNTKTVIVLALVLTEGFFCKTEPIVSRLALRASKSDLYHLNESIDDTLSYQCIDAFQNGSFFASIERCSSRLSALNALFSSIGQLWDANL